MLIEIEELPCRQHGCDARLFAKNPDGSGVYGHRVPGEREPHTIYKPNYFQIL